MQRLNRSAHAPIGKAFFLFLGLAILPISLRAAGFQVSFSPSLSAAIDAWQQIADVFGAEYQPARASDLSAPNDSDREPLKASSACPRSEFACAREIEQLSGSVQVASKVSAPKGGYLRGACPRTASRASAGTRPVEPDIAAAAIQAILEKRARTLEALSAIKLETMTRDGLLKSIEKHMAGRSLETVKNLPIPQSLRVFVRVKPPAIPSATKAAECKGRAALASAQRLERERAILTSMPSTSPDNCDL